MRTAFITEDLGEWEGHLHPGGCAYYRQLLPKNAAGPLSMFGRPAWSGQYGFGVMVGKSLAQFGFETVVMKSIMARWTPRQMEVAQALGQRIIVDIDDHFDGLHEANRAHKTTDPSVNKIHNRANLRAIVEQADVVTVSTPFLRDWYKDMGVKDVRLIRNGINPNQFKPRKHKTRKPVIGWAGAIGWRSNDIETLRPWLNDWLAEHDLMFHHAGDEPNFPPFHEVAGVNPARVTAAPMENIPQYASMLTFDIGIVPLSDIPFNHAKSCIKGLEYAASGIPFVASALPEYRRLADMGVGRTADTDARWVDHMTALLDYHTRKAEAVHNRALTLRDHTIRNTAPEWAALFQEGADRQVPIRSVRVPYVHT